MTDDDTGNTGHESVSNREEANLKVYKYRWFILFMFFLYAGINFIAFLQYSVITNIIARYYDISIFAVSWTSLVFMISYIILFIPASYLVEKFSLRQMSIFVSTLTAFGVCIRLFSVTPESFYIVIIGQTFCAIAQVFIMSLPSKLAATWFGRKEVSTACAIAVFGSQLGISIGCVVSPNVINNHDDIDLIGDELFTMMVYNSIFAYAISFLVVVFFESKPPSPPSYSQLLIQNNTRPEYIKSLKVLIKNKDYVLLLIIIGVTNGMWNAFGIQVNTIYLNYFPDKEADVGYIALMAMAGSFVLGYVLDKTHKFKLTTFVILFVSSIMYFVATILMEEKQRIAALLSIGIYGFLITGALTVGYEFSAEVTYPEPEGTTLALLNACIFFFGLIFSVIMDALFTSIGFFWTNITIGSVLCAFSLLTIFLTGNLKRLNTNQIQKDS